MIIYCVLIISLMSVYHVVSESCSGINCHKAWHKLDSQDCGISVADRIFGGVNAALGQFPWLVRIGYKVDGEDELDWMCGGALITDQHVLTAAHCLQAAEDYVLSSIRVGEYDVNTNPDCQLGVCAPPIQDRKVKKVLIHPSFNKPMYNNDVAIVVMDNPVQLSDYVSPICLPKNEQAAPVKVGELLNVAGWGKMNMTTEERAKILQFVAVPIVPPETCQTLGRRFKVAETQLCAGAQLNKDTCGGDSGGPLMKVFDTRDGPKTFSIGVVSFGPTICGIKKPGVYTSVPHFMQWILDSIS